MKRRLHWRRRTAIFRPLDQSDRLKLAGGHLARAAALLQQEMTYEEDAGRSGGKTWRAIFSALASLSICCDRVADLLPEEDEDQ